MLTTHGGVGKLKGKKFTNEAGNFLTKHFNQTTIIPKQKIVGLKKGGGVNLTQDFQPNSAVTAFAPPKRKTKRGHSGPHKKSNGNISLKPSKSKKDSIDSIDLKRVRPGTGKSKTTPKPVKAKAKWT